MAKNATTTGSTQIGVCNGNTEGYATAASVAAIIEPHLTPDGEASVSASAPITGDGTAANPLTVTDASLQTALGGSGAVQGVIDAVEQVPAASAADIAAIDGTTELLMKNDSGDLVCVTADDLGIGGGGGGGGSPFTGYHVGLINHGGGGSTSFTTPAAGVVVAKQYFSGSASGSDNTPIMGQTVSAGQTFSVSGSDSVTVRWFVLQT